VTSQCPDLPVTKQVPLSGAAVTCATGAIALAHPGRRAVERPGLRPRTVARCV